MMDSVVRSKLEEIINGRMAAKMRGKSDNREDPNRNLD